MTAAARARREPLSVPQYGGYRTTGPTATMAERTQRRKPDEGLGPLAELQLDGGPKPDRLPPMLFLAALLHGILIIGITFNAIVDDANSESVSLEVTIVADPDRNVARDEPAE